MRDCRVNGCALMSLPVKGDARGSLIAIEGRRDVPFDVARVYYVFGTKPGVDRGFHAHRNLSQLLIAVSGSCTIMVDDGKSQELVRLADPTIGLSITGLVWREMRNFSADCVLLVLADAPYDESDYIRDHDRFLDAVSESGK